MRKLKTKEAASLLGVNSKTVIDMVRDGRLSGIIIPGPNRSIVRVDDDSVQAYLKGQSQAELS